MLLATPKKTFAILLQYSKIYLNSMNVIVIIQQTGASVMHLEVRFCIFCVLPYTVKMN